MCPRQRFLQTEKSEQCHLERAAFDGVATFSIEGLSKSAIARVKRMAWRTVDRWLQKAADSCCRFNDHRIAGITITALQADGIRAIIPDQEQPIRVFGSILAWSRLWPSTAWEGEGIETQLALPVISPTEQIWTLVCDGHPPCFWNPLVCTDRSSRPEGTIVGLRSREQR